MLYDIVYITNMKCMNGFCNLKPPLSPIFDNSNLQSFTWGKSQKVSSNGSVAGSSDGSQSGTESEEESSKSLARRGNDGTYTGSLSEAFDKVTKSLGRSSKGSIKNTTAQLVGSKKPQTSIFSMHECSDYESDQDAVNGEEGRLWVYE